MATTTDIREITMADRLKYMAKLKDEKAKDEFVVSCVAYGVGLEAVKMFMLNIDSMYDVETIYNKYVSHRPLNYFNIDNFKKNSALLDYGRCITYPVNMVEEVFGVTSKDIIDVSGEELYEAVSKFIDAYKDLNKKEQCDTNLFIISVYSKLSKEDEFEPFNNGLKKTFALFDRNGVEYYKAYSLAMETASYDRVEHNTILSYQIIRSIFENL